MTECLERKVASEVVSFQVFVGQKQTFCRGTLRYVAFRSAKGIMLFAERTAAYQLRLCSPTEGF